MSTSASKGADVSGLPSICSAMLAMVRPTYVSTRSCAAAGAGLAAMHDDETASAARMRPSFENVLDAEVEPERPISFLERIQEI
jgi:hypothetical protein